MAAGRITKRTVDALQTTGKEYVHWDGELIGFITVLVSVLGHYGFSVAVSESYFVAKEHRHTMAGLKLLVAAEEKTKALGALGIYVSSPTGGALDKVLERSGYAETNRIYFKRMGFDA